MTKHVVITGASTGIGEACTLEMAARGWHVFAGVRKAEDGEALVAQAGPAVTPLLLDVTRRDHIIDAERRVRDTVGGIGLAGLVNNAGIAVAGPLEFLPMEDIERQFRVNVLGVIGMIQAFLPLVRMARGRLIVMGSNSGFWCEPFVAVYGASKFALEGMVDSLRTELRPWGIGVAMIEPGCVRTPILQKSRADVERRQAHMSPEMEVLYGRPLAALRSATEMAERMAIPPGRVARAVCHALESRRPKTRYRVGMDSRIQSLLARWLPDRWRDYLSRRVMGL
ncbi:MAG TPA: SDR family NAD(P)-dependent oxidoreductase [Candidatus Hydrogenedentes bacterium]|nr:SDR family NAD(P)-dependent oxidoreductase [Candidatus Hydrogenedentota bacterium]